MRFLNRTAASRAFATQEIGAVHPPAADYPERAAGLLAIPISRAPRDFLVFFRREIARTVTWAGNPEKLVAVGPLGDRLTPRKSFEAWREVVRGRSLPWSDAETRTADSVRRMPSDSSWNTPTVSPRAQANSRRRAPTPCTQRGF